MNNNTDNRRLYLAVALSAAVLFVWQKWFMPKPKPHLGADGGAVAKVIDGGSALPKVAAAGVATPPPSVKPEVPGAPKPPEQTTTFDQKDRTLVFSSYGGTLKSAVLKGEQFKHEVDGKVVQVNMVEVENGQPLPFSTTLSGGFPKVPADLPYTMVRNPDGVTFTGQVGALAITKRYVVPEHGYDLALEVTLRNTGSVPLAGELGVAVDTFVKPGSEPKRSFLMREAPVSHRLPLARVGKDTHRQAKDKDGKAETVSGPLRFMGIDEQYFLAALYPVSPTDAAVTLTTPLDGLRQAIAQFKESVAPGASQQTTFGIFVGPKSKDVLENAGASIPELKGAAPGLKDSVEYGMMEVISLMLLVVMRLFHSVIPNWGVAIILLTVAVKIATLPLTMKQMASAEKMKVLQPQMNAIKEKFKGDKERQNTETMKLYQQSGVNPLSGCLPMLVQLPVFWGLWRLLEYAFDIYRQPFISPWIKDLSAQDPTYVLPVLLIVTMFGSQLMMPTMGDAAQQKLMKYVMPVMFGVFMIGLPAGLSLYYVVNNLLNIAQQLYLRRKFPAARPPDNQNKNKKSRLATA